MIVRIIMTVIAYLIIGSASAWVAYHCWKDSKDDFKMVFRDFRNYFKNKRAD